MCRAGEKCRFWLTLRLSRSFALPCRGPRYDQGPEYGTRSPMARQSERFCCALRDPDWAADRFFPV